MQILTTIGREFLGLFVADARFTGALAAWIAIVAMISPFHRPENGVEAVLLFAGFAAILVENLVHVASER